MKTSEIYNSLKNHYSSNLEKGLSISELKDMGIDVKEEKDGSSTILKGEEGGYVAQTVEVIDHDKVYEIRPDTNIITLISYGEGNTKEDETKFLLNDTDLL